MAGRYIAAAKDGNVDILRAATRKDLNTHDEDGMTATAWAAHNGNLEALRLIVGREGDVNKADYLGLSALHHAAMRGHLDVVSFLVHWGCNVYALDNDLHSAQDLASIHDHHEIISFLDKILDQKRYKNPKSAIRQKEEAIKNAEISQKKYEKLKEAAAKKAEKEQKRMEKEIHSMESSSSKPKKNIFQTLTLRVKGNNNGTTKSSAGGQSNFSSMAGMTGNSKGVSKKIQMRRNVDAAADTKSTRSEFKVSVRDDEGNRTLKSIGRGEGVHGTVTDVMYMNSSRRTSETDIIATRRPTASDVFHNKQNIYRAKSEPDLLDSGVDSYYGEEDDEEDNPSSLFNRAEFGKLSFLPKNPMLSTLQSFEDGVSHDPEVDDHDDLDNLAMEHQQRPLNGDDNSFTKLPWDLDDVDGLDEIDDSGTPKTALSSLEMFLSSSGLTSYLHIFSKEEIDLQILVDMTEPDLQSLGLPWAPRKKLLEAIHRRKMVLQTPSTMSDSYL